MYALLADRLEARVLTERIVAATLIAAGGKGEMPDPDDELAAFDTALTAEPKRLHDEQETLLRGLGLRGR